MEGNSQMVIASDPRVGVNVFGNIVVNSQTYLCRVVEIGWQSAVVEPWTMPNFDTREIGVQFCLPDDRQVLWCWYEVVERTPKVHRLRFRYTVPYAKDRIRRFLTEHGIVF